MARRPLIPRTMSRAPPLAVAAPAAVACRGLPSRALGLCAAERGAARAPRLGWSGDGEPSQGEAERSRGATAAAIVAGVAGLAGRVSARRSLRRRLRAKVPRPNSKADEPAVQLDEESLMQAQIWEEMWAEEKDPYGDALEEQRSAQDLLQKKRVMLMISDTGGGHRASARALADALEEQYPDQLTITIRDVWTEDCPWPFNTVVQNYTLMAKFPIMWRIFFFTSKFPITRWFSQRFANVRCKKAFRHAIERDDPDLIVSLHPCTQHIVIKVLRRLARRTRRRIPFVTVVTDLGGAHPMWFHPEADRVFVPSDNLQAMALRLGVRESALHMYGLPLRRDFWAPEKRTREEVREDLGLQRDALTVLVVGGGDGVGKLQNVAKAMGREMGEALDKETNLVVVCGKNEKVQAKLKAEDWPDNVNAHIVGFVSNMDEWMAACDVIVTKAGPGTIAEATTRALPVMLSSFLPGQEKGNVDFVEEQGFGSYSSKPDVIAKTVTSWLKDPEELAKRSKLSAACSRPNATQQIAEVIGTRWLTTDVYKITSALVAKLRASLTRTKAARSSVPAEGEKTQRTEQALKEAVIAKALAELKEAEQHLQKAKQEVRDAKQKSMSALHESEEAKEEEKA